MVAFCEKHIWKKVYYSFEAAMGNIAVTRALNHPSRDGRGILQPYRCYSCNHYHLGHIPRKAAYFPGGYSRVRNRDVFVRTAEETIIYIKPQYRRGKLKRKMISLPL